MKKIFLINLIITIFFTLIFYSNPIFAYNFGEKSGLDAAAKQTGHAGNTFTNQDLPTLVGKVISILLSLLGIIFLGLIIFAGYRWMTAAGEEEKVNTAKDTLKTSVIGLIIVIAAYAITSLVSQYLLKN